jgi:uncharacterized protein YcbX
VTSTPRIAELWRHPVKSLRGERLDEAVLGPDGLVGDREWGLRDQGTGRILTARRRPELLQASSRLVDGRPVIELPDGTTLPGPGAATDETLTAWLGSPVRLVAAAGGPGGRAEFFADATDDSSEALEWTMPAGRFVDALPLLVLTTASLRHGARLHPDGAWESRRFRPNLLVDVPVRDDEGFLEDAWCGGTLTLGDVVVAPEEPCSRCTMVTRPQPGLPDDRDVFRTLARHHRGAFGVWARVTAPGTVRVGDRVDVQLP